MKLDKTTTPNEDTLVRMAALQEAVKITAAWVEGPKDTRYSWDPDVYALTLARSFEKYLRHG